jgi:hypothetical protein
VTAATDGHRAVLPSGPVLHSVQPPADIARTDRAAPLLTDVLRRLHAVVDTVQRSTAPARALLGLQRSGTNVQA